MPIAKITGQGLAAIGFSVALLWGCIIADRVAAREAYAERARVMRVVEMHQGHHRSLPVSVPLPRHSHAPVNAG
jgi:hypothetical protein